VLLRVRYVHFMCTRPCGSMALQKKPFHQFNAGIPTIRESLCLLEGRASARPHQKISDHTKRSKMNSISTIPKNLTRAAKANHMLLHTIRDDRDFRLHCDYIHYNPVKHVYASSAQEWPHSSFRNYVGRGLYETDRGTLPMSFSEIDVRE